ncbi:MAG TPA: hypothetical protein PK299_15805 [Anaerolineales bacterium]|nr:hypothetical protein [Anaerolineales bacterium]
MEKAQYFGRAEYNDSMTSEVQVRDFSWRDFWLLQRVLPHAVYTFQQAAVTGQPPVVISTLQSYLSPQANGYAWLAHTPHHTLVAQMVFNSHQHLAHMYFLAASESQGLTEPASMSALLTQGAHMAGEQGMHYLVVELDSQHPSIAHFHSVGFTVYTHQSIWRLSEKTHIRKSPPFLRKPTSQDLHAIAHLCHDVTPRMVQTVEWQRPLQTEPDGWVLEDGGDILAFFAVTSGIKGIFVKPYVHPQAESRLGELFSALLSCEFTRENRPFYLCLRNYQYWMSRHLAGLGFSPMAEQQVLAKRLVIGLPIHSTTAHEKVSAWAGS